MRKRTILWSICSITAIEQAILLLQQVLAINPDYLNGRAASQLEHIRLQFLRLQAREAEKAKEYRDAERFWRELLSLDSKDREANKRLRRLLWQCAEQAREEGQWTQEIEILRELRGREHPITRILIINGRINAATKNRRYNASISSRICLAGSRICNGNTFTGNSISRICLAGSSNSNRSSRSNTRSNSRKVINKIAAIVCIDYTNLSGAN